MSNLLIAMCVMICASFDGAYVTYRPQDDLCVCHTLGTRTKFSVVRAELIED